MHAMLLLAFSRYPCLEPMHVDRSSFGDAVRLNEQHHGPSSPSMQCGWRLQLATGAMNSILLDLHAPYHGMIYINLLSTAKDLYIALLLLLVILVHHI
jgi:hypothetical protein